MIFLRYITLLEYPSPLGNRLQVIKMSEAFSGVSDFELWLKSFPENEDGIFEEYGVKSPINIKRLGGWGSFWPKSFWAARSIAKRIVRELQGVVFFTRDVLLAFFLTFLSARFRENFFFEIHSLGKFPDAIYRRVFRYARGIISTNAAKKEKICARWGIPPQKILVAPNGVDLRLFERLPSKEEARKEFFLPQGKKIAMYTGSEQKWKGTGIIGELAGKFPEILFVRVGGKGESRGNMIVLPWTPYARLPRLLSAADILLMTLAGGDTRAERWTSPIKIPTYMASGVPIVAPRLSSVEELLDEDTAFLAEENTVESFSEQISLALGEKGEAGRRAYLAREKAKELDWRVRAKKIAAFFARG